MLDTPHPSASTMPLTVRMRRSPFWEKSHACGAQGYIVYNNMLIATGFRSAEEDYKHLKSAVQLWDVGVQRQIEISGPDAARLIQMSTPRDISQMQEDQCYYIPTVDHLGGMTNDPVLLRLEEDRFWVSISDSDLLLFYRGVAGALGLNVSVFEADVSPLAIQGPMADKLASRIWGEHIEDVRFFRHKRVDVGGKMMVLARSGFSVQGGFELYFEGETGASELWDQLMEVGKDLDVRAGTPCQAERVEAGLLSYLSDITNDMTLYEAGLESFCAKEDVGCLGWDALKRRRSPARQIRPIEIAGDPLPPQSTFWEIQADGASVGRISSSCYAFDFGCNAAIGLVNEIHWGPGTSLTVLTPTGARDAIVKDKFWGRP